MKNKLKVNKLMLIFTLQTNYTKLTKTDTSKIKLFIIKT